MTIESWLASRDPFRVVAMGIPRAQPLIKGPCSQSVSHIHGQYVEPHQRRILADCRITYSSIGLYRMRRRDQIFSDLNTLLIETKDVETTGWKEAAHQLIQLYRLGGLSGNEIEVEIQNPDRMIANQSYPLGVDEAVLSAIDQVQPRFLDVVRAELRGIWSSVAFHRRAPRRNPDAEKKPTVVVFCHEGSICDFTTVYNNLAKVLVKAPAKLHVEIAAGSVT